MPAGLARTAQTDFAAGIFPSVARHLVPPNGLRDLRDGLLDGDGNVYKRGGAVAKTATFGSSGLQAIWDGWTAGGQRTLLAASGGFAVVGADGQSVVSLGGSGIAVPQRAAAVAGLVFIGAHIYGGSRKAADYSTGTVAVTNGSKVVTKAGGGFTANVDVGMLFRQSGTERYYAVASVDSDTQVTLTDAYGGATNGTAGFTLTRLGLATTTPYQSGSYLAVAGRRLLAATGDTMRFSGRDNPHSWGANDYHRVPGGVTISGVYGLRDEALIFTSRGLYSASQMTLDLVDPSGNPQQTLALSNGELVLWGEPGLAGWNDAVIAPALDHVWLIQPGHGAEQLTRSTWTMLREYVRAGYRPGQAAVYLNHYFLPVLDAVGNVVDVLVCRLDRPIQTRQGAVYPWSRLRGAGAAHRCYAAVAGGQALYGGEAANTSRAFDCSGYFEPSLAPAADPGGAAIEFELVTGDVATGQLNENLVRRVRVGYELIDPAAGARVPNPLTYEEQPYRRDGGTAAGAYNTVLLPSAPLDPNSAQMASELALDVAGNRPGMNSDSAPVFIAQAGDPVWTVTASGSGGTTTIRAPQALQNLLPIGSTWGPVNGDKPLELFDPITTPGTFKEVRCWNVTALDQVNHTISCVNLGVPSQGYGPTSDVIPWAQGWGTGCGLPIAAGLLRMADFTSGAIRHAIRVAGPPYIKNTFRAPAQSSDQHGTGRRGGLPGFMEMGVRLRLKSTVNPDIRTCWNPTGQVLTPEQTANRIAWMRMICQALKTYGMIVSDGLGDPTWNFQMELDTRFGGTADWEAVFGPNPIGAGTPYWGWMLRGLTTEGYSGSSPTDGLPWDQFEVVANGAPVTTSLTPPELAVYFSDGRPIAGNSGEWGLATWGAFEWGATDAAEWAQLNGTAPPDDGRHPFSWRVSRRCRYGRYRLLSSDPTTKLTIRSMETFVRQSGKP